MSDTAYKQHLRRRQRREADPDIPGSLANKGWRVDIFNTGPFHILARRGKTALAIRICFVYTTTEDILSVSREPVPDRCLREIWQISQDGRTIVRVKINGRMK
ncbi:MAG: hypothetical protein IMZ62_15880 [Chloroflexi bacterium]|nr:hypothetical protein [Chloroflexota bacterium]